MRPAVFLDRDGVLVEEGELITRESQLRLLEANCLAAAELSRANRLLVVITNQTVVARGLVTMTELEGIHAALADRLLNRGASIARFYVCPHHPNADLPAYRALCDCRKPRPGLLLRARDELGIDLARSVMVGDRMSDVAAGARAGCATLLLETNHTTLPPIESPDPVDSHVPSRTAASLAMAVDWVLAVTS